MAAERTPETEAMADKLDDAKKRLRSQGEAMVDAAVERKARRPASYHVFRLEPSESDEPSFWAWLTEAGAVKVESLGREESKKREAIKMASSDLAPDQLNGTFVAVREDEWFPMPRRVEQRLEDVFE
jgi:hypothetical protein